MRKKVLGGTILGLIGFAVGSFGIYYLLEQEAQQYESVIGVHFPLQERIAKLRLLLERQHSIIKSFRAAGDPSLKHEFQEVSARIHELLDAGIEVRPAPTGESSTVAELWGEFEAVQRACERCEQIHQKLFGHLAAGEMAEAMESMTEAAVIAEDVKQGVDRFEEQLKHHRQDAIAQASAVRESLQNLFIGLVLAAVLLGVLANVFFYRSLLPLKAMVDAVRRIARGDYDVRLPAKGGDEISIVVREFNSMATALEEQRRSIDQSHTEKLQLERMVRHTEKLSAVGELALGIAHEVRNPLSTIQMTLHTLDKRDDLRATERERVGLARREVSRLEGLVSSMLEYGRPTEPRMVKVDIPQLIRNSIKLVEPESARCHVEARIESCDAGLPQTEADSDQVTQILVNLLLNAIQASSPGSTVRASAGVVSNWGSEGAISVSISDSGPGIKPDELDRLFTPFFTSRQDGTGLGLPLARRIAEAHGGELTLDSTAGEGTTARLILPLRKFSSPNTRSVNHAGV